MFQEAEVPPLALDHQLLILAILEDTILLPEVLLILQDMIEALLLLTTDLLYLGIILALLLHLITEARVHLTITQDHLADLITTIHRHTAPLVDQIQVTQEAAAIVLQVEAQVDPREVATPEVPEEEGGINSPLFFV